MKFHFLLFTMFGFYSAIAQQNLVANGSFEDYSTCPTDLFQITNAEGWMSFRYTPDYLNECAASTNVWIPASEFGYQFPFDGSAYMGVTTYHWVLYDWHEYIATELIEPMQIGSTYFISFRACLALKNNGCPCLQQTTLAQNFQLY